MPVSNPTPLAWSKPEAAEACRVSTRTISNWVKHRGFPHVRIGSRILFPVDGVREWLSAQASGGIDR